MKFSYLLMILIFLGVSGCSQGFEIEQNNDSISNDVTIEVNQVEENLNDNQIEEQELLVESSEVNKKSVNLIKITNSLNSISINEGEEYALSVEYDDEIYQYSFLIEDTNNEVIIYLDGIEVPLSLLSIYFNFDNKEISLEKENNEKFILVFKELSKELDKEFDIENQKYSILLKVNQDNNIFNGKII